MQYGFVIDHGKCIGCHACTVACKAENDVPLDKFRTWVKYTESGHFPEVKRSFAVLRCNQCTSAPCVTICPVHALHKREDGIVDIDPQRCIGCKSCMQACPYDALYINDDEGVAEKCHFCAHRVEQNLAPACAVVCPTEAIIPGDFDDPASTVSKLKAQGDLSARKLEAGTGPNVWYREAAPAGLEPLEANHAGGYLWAQQRPGEQLDAQRFEQFYGEATARATYDVQHPPMWGGKLTAYLFCKSVAAGIWLAAGAALPPMGSLGGPPLAWLAGLSLLFLTLTTGLLVFDLKRPERFLYILRYPNWSSWLVRGSYILMLHGLLSTAWLGIGLLGPPAAGEALLPAVAWTLWAATMLCSIAAAAYTAWLFAQARGRALWMQQGFALVLVVHALLAGAALLFPLSFWSGGTVQSQQAWLLVGSIVASWFLHRTAKMRAPRGREQEYRRALRLIEDGPYRSRHQLAVVFFGLLIPAAAVVVVSRMPGMEPLTWLAAVGVWVGLWFDQDNTIRAGQALPIS